MATTSKTDEAKTSTSSEPKRDYKAEAQTLIDPDAKKAGAVDVLAKQLEEQDKADTPADVQQFESTTIAAAHSEGGGPWPPELLSRGVAPGGAVVTFAPEQHYTSHEDPPKA